MTFFDVLCLIVVFQGIFPFLSFSFLALQIFCVYFMMMILPCLGKVCQSFFFCILLVYLVVFYSILKYACLYPSEKKDGCGRRWVGKWEDLGRAG